MIDILIIIVLNKINGGIMKKVKHVLIGILFFIGIFVSFFIGAYINNGILFFVLPIIFCVIAIITTHFISYCKDNFKRKYSTRIKISDEIKAKLGSLDNLDKVLEEYEKMKGKIDLNDKKHTEDSKNNLSFNYRQHKLSRKAYLSLSIFVAILLYVFMRYYYYSINFLFIHIFTTLLLVSFLLAKIKMRTPFPLSKSINKIIFSLEMMIILLSFLSLNYSFRYHFGSDKVGSVFEKTDHEGVCKVLVKFGRSNNTIKYGEVLVHSFYVDNGLLSIPKKSIIPIKIWVNNSNNPIKLDYDLFFNDPLYFNLSYTKFKMFHTLSGHRVFLKLTR